MRKLLLATTNKGKIEELLALTSDLPFEIKTLDDFKDIKNVAETGKTFVENANLKSHGYALQTKCLTLADDSGLEVDALSGAPGVLSARYSGANSNDYDNIVKVLKKLAALKSSDRTARFVCAMSLNDGNKICYTGEGVCEGTIALNPMGSNGFGYDPVFIPHGFDRTFGELTAEMKAKVSHRSIALQKIIDILSEIGSC